MNLKDINLKWYFVTVTIAVVMIVWGQTVMSQGNNPPFNLTSSINSTMNISCGDTQLMFNKPCWNRVISYAWDITSYGNVSINQRWINASGWVKIGNAYIQLFQNSTITHGRTQNAHRVVWSRLTNMILLEFNRNTTFILNNNRFREPNAIARGGGRNK